MSNSPKKVSITLTDPRSTQKKPSPDRHNLKKPLSVLKKTFKEGDVYDHIRFEQQRRVQEHEAQRKRELALKEEAIRDEYQRPAITKDQLELCKYLFRELTAGRKTTCWEDLVGSKNQQVRRVASLLKVVYTRKQDSEFFDFVYALWDSGLLQELVTQTNI